MTQSLHPEREVLVTIKWAPEPVWKLLEKINIPEAYLDSKFSWSFGQRRPLYHFSYGCKYFICSYCWACVNLPCISLVVIVVTRLGIKVLRVVNCHEKTNQFCVPRHCTALTTLEVSAALILSRSAPTNQQ